MKGFGLPCGGLFLSDLPLSHGSRPDTDFGFSAEQQFDGVRKAAYILAEKTQELAC